MESEGASKMSCSLSSSPTPEIVAEVEVEGWDSE